MSESPTLSHSSGKFQTSIPQAGLHTCEPCGTSCQQMAEAQITEDRDTFSLNRTNSADGPISLGSQGRGNPNRFHPYRRQFSDGALPAAGCLQQCPSSFSCLLDDPDTRLHSLMGEAPASWDQSLYSELPTLSEPPCSLSQSYPSYSSSSPLQQVSSSLYSNDDQSNSSKYSLQSLSTQSHPENITQSSFPKPIYSYSILIFLALKNSKTGSLPVSEIYSFMTEHFPYFKSAPDGWKNSVRHNLSLNKCFEKVENKNGNSSRKGCLWSLNPAKVEKMQEELHKWRRKDPIAVRRSMARPEDLAHLLGQRPEKLKCFAPYTNPASSSRVAPLYGNTSSSCTLTQLRPPFQRSAYTHVHPQRPYYLPPAAAHPSNSFALYSPCGQQPAASVPSATGSLHSPTDGKMPPVHNAALQAEYSSRGMQELLDGDGSYDIDTLNPSLTELQLQGNLWEELQEGSLVSDPQITTLTPSTTFALQTSCLQVMSPTEGLKPEVAAAVDRRKAVCDHENRGLHPVVYSGVEGVAGYLTSCTASITLM